MNILESIQLMKNIGADECNRGFNLYLELEDGGIELWYDTKEDIFEIILSVDNTTEYYKKESYEIHGVFSLLEFTLQKLSEIKFEQGRENKALEIRNVLNI